MCVSRTAPAWPVRLSLLASFWEEKVHSSFPEMVNCSIWLIRLDVFWIYFHYLSFATPETMKDELERIYRRAGSRKLWSEIHTHTLTHTDTYFCYFFCYILPGPVLFWNSQTYEGLQKSWIPEVGKLRLEGQMWPAELFHLAHRAFTIFSPNAKLRVRVSLIG